MKGVVEKIEDNVSIDATAIYTDESNLYATAPGCIKRHEHQTVKHKEKEWVRGDVHTRHGLRRHHRLLPSGVDKSTCAQACAATWTSFSSPGTTARPRRYHLSRS